MVRTAYTLHVIRAHFQGFKPLSLKAFVRVSTRVWLS